MTECDRLIEIENMQDIIEVEKEDLDSLIKDCILKVLDKERFPHKVMVSINLVDNAHIRKINREFRNIDAATDVLSFPMLDIGSGGVLGEFDDLRYDIDPETDALILGDIMISLEKAKEQAHTYGHSLRRETGFLVIHGMLHLLGYDHIDYEDKAIMRDREKIILEELGLSRDLK